MVEDLLKHLHFMAFQIELMRIVLAKIVGSYFANCSQYNIKSIINFELKILKRTCVKWPVPGVYPGWL